jgi:hypothetical protein
MSLAALGVATRDPGRVVALGYLLIAVTPNFVWETAQLPLYTIWQTGSAGELAFVILHCTGGDLLILAASLMLALLLISDANWPRFGYRWVVLATVGEMMSHCSNGARPVPRGGISGITGA